MIVEALSAALICLDPGHGTPPAVGRQTEPIGPGSRVRKIKDGGGASGEAEVALAIARKTRTLLLRPRLPGGDDPHGPVFTYGTGGNVARAQFCNRRHATLMLRIHADGSTEHVEPRDRDALPVVPPRLDGRHLRAEPARGPPRPARDRLGYTARADHGLVRRSRPDRLQLGERARRSSSRPGFMTNPTERRRLQSSSYQWQIARGFTAGVAAFTPPR